ncbi:hypothetical protein HGT73_08605 [Rosenbergiella australiborealis]|uniref:Prophage protein n=1 Tax=Rosenbergiella australiborealis TaxID=1544696 RepID=A0ABS5T530_9GAMM|nr:hypothetical protein [Rosenbergiella australiborealis]MBT0727446.1 hypothetical protein [Rosenbergiella australiborealis]
MNKSELKPVLLSREQIEILQAIQREERRKSPLNVAPTIHVIARHFMAKALEGLEVKHG